MTDATSHVTIDPRDPVRPPPPTDDDPDPDDLDDDEEW